MMHCRDQVCRSLADFHQAILKILVDGFDTLARDLSRIIAQYAYVPCLAPQFFSWSYTYDDNQDLQNEQFRQPHGVKDECTLTSVCGCAEFGRRIFHWTLYRTFVGNTNPTFIMNDRFEILKCQQAYCGNHAYHFQGLDDNRYRLTFFLGFDLTGDEHHEVVLEFDEPLLLSPATRIKTVTFVDDWPEYQVMSFLRQIIQGTDRFPVLPHPPVQLEQTRHSSIK